MQFLIVQLDRGRLYLRQETPAICWGSRENAHPYSSLSDARAALVRFGIKDATIEVALDDRDRPAG